MRGTCAQAKGLTVVKVLRLAPPHLAPQGAWQQLGVSLQTTQLHASFAAVCMPRSCLDRPMVLAMLRTHCPAAHCSSSAHVMWHALWMPIGAERSMRTCAQVYDKDSVAVMLATMLSAECVQSGVEALRQCSRTGSDSLLAGLPEDPTR